MRVNIIYNAQSTGLHQDAHLLNGMLVVSLGKDIVVRHVPHYFPQCEEAELNFFIESINPSLFVYASKNILIPNPEWTFQTWKPYVNMIDDVWVKTKEAVEIFGNAGVPAKYIGWTSVDKMMPDYKDYEQAIVPIGKNVWRHPKPIIQAYMRIKTTDPALFFKLPVVHLVHTIDLPPIPESVELKFISHHEKMPVADYDKLLQTCGLIISTSAAEGFGHAVNEGMSAGCIPMLSPIGAHIELFDQGRFFTESKSYDHPECLGRLMDITVASVINQLVVYVEDTQLFKEKESIKARQAYETRHEEFLERMDVVIQSLVRDMPEYSLQDKLPKESELPAVSIVTITRDRRAFIPLAKYCFIAQSYPAEKMEWVIVDDGNDQIKDLVSDIPNMKYVLSDKKLTIGAKRNLAVSSCSHDIIVMMDDDDVYPNNSVLTRVANMLAEPRKECLFSTVIPCYEIHEKKSFMNAPPVKLAMGERVSEATLCFTKKFWNDRKFPDKQIAEAGEFITGRENQCREFSPQDIIVSLIHKHNTSARKPPPMETNGCHYGFSDELFTLVSEIGNTL
jgi:hypothetical protein